MNFDWEKHYKNGGVSGDPADYEKSRQWKHNIVLMHYTPCKDSIIDLACGDLQFWVGILPSNYTGVDISQTIIDRNKKNHAMQKFICSNAATPLDIKADVVICFDMLWHVIDDDQYVKILQNIKSYSKKYIYIYTWNANPQSLFTQILKPFVNNDSGIEYQKYRDYLSISTPIFEPWFKLIETHTNDIWKFGTMYVYEKV